MLSHPELIELLTELDTTLFYPSHSLWEIHSNFPVWMYSCSVFEQLSLNSPLPNQLFWLPQASCFHVYAYWEKLHFSPLSIFFSLWTNWIHISSSVQAQPLDRCGAQTASPEEQFKLAEWFSDTPVSQQFCPAFPVPKAGSHPSHAFPAVIGSWLFKVLHYN